MYAGDTAVELIGHIEDRRIGVSELRIERQHLLRHGQVVAMVMFDLVEDLNRALRPDGPLSKQPAHHPELDISKLINGEQVVDDVVVIACVDRDLAGSSTLGHRTHHVDRLVAMEGRYLDRDYIVDLGEASPEAVGKHSASDGWLQVEADNR